MRPSKILSVSDVNIAQAEEGIAKPRSKYFKDNNGILHGLLSQDDVDYELTRDWNALADEDLVLPNSYAKDRTQSPLREAPTAPKRINSLRRGRSPPAGRISIEVVPRLSIDPGVQQDLDSRLYRDRRRESFSVAMLNKLERNSRSLERRPGGHRHSVTGSGESAVGRQRDDSECSSKTNERVPLREAVLISRRKIIV